MKSAALQAFWMLALHPSCWFRRHAWRQRTERGFRDLRESVTEDDRFCTRCARFSA